MSGVLRSSLGLRPASKTHLRKIRLSRAWEIPEVVFKPFQAAGLCSESDKKPRGSLEPGPAPWARQPSPVRATSPPRARWATARLQATVPTVQVLP